MDYISTLSNQIILMFIIIVLGYILKKIEFYSDTFVKDLGNLLFVVINPLTIFNAFVNQYSISKAKEMLIGFSLVILIYIVSIVFANILFHNPKYYIEKFGSIVNNPGFFGLPIIIAVFGQEAVFYAAASITINTIVQWTYGAYIMSGDKKAMSIKTIITNTSIIAFVLGLIFFFARIRVPQIVCNTISSLSNMMGPICSLIVGSNLVGVNLKKLKENIVEIVVCLLRLIIVPLCAVFILKFISNDYFMLKFTLLIALSTPCGSSTAVFANMYNKDYEKAAMLVCLCTLLCGITMPLITSLAIKIW